MPDIYNNKVVLADGTVLIDLTADTVTASDLASGVTAHDMSGAPITGTSTKDVDSSDATVAAAEIIAGKTAYARGTKLTGTMVNNGAVTVSISDLTAYTIPAGFHDGSGTVSIAAAEIAKIIAANIKEGVTILGVTGTYTGEGVTAQSKSVAPSFSPQSILPDAGYDYLSEVTVAAIAVTYSENAAGGNTVTIG